MAAFVKHRFRKGFLLDEERIRKINAILNERLASLETSTQPSYKVYRADAFSYTTSDVADVVHEENSDWQKITRITVSAASDDKLRLALDFHESGSGLEIEGEDRDFVYLIFSDLREYISNEVNVVRSVPKRAGAILGLMVALGVLLVAGTLLWSHWTAMSAELAQMVPDPTIVETVLRSNDVHEKLNYMIERGTTSAQSDLASLMRSLVFSMVAMWGIPLLPIVGDIALQRLIDYFLPRNLFLFGREIDRYAQRRAVRSRLFWGIVVAFPVSTAAGFLVWLLTKR
jgi:hypothetical protein